MFPTCAIRTAYEWEPVSWSRQHRSATPSAWTSGRNCPPPWDFAVGHAKPSHGEEIYNDALSALLRSHLELNQRDLDNLNLKIQNDSFIHLCPENLFLRPIAHAPPPSRCFLRAAGHIFVPDGQLGALRSGYSRPLHSTIQRADAMLASFLSRTGGSWTPASGHTWKNQ